MSLVVPNAQSVHTARKRQKILAAAARIFAEEGYAGASIRDISRASGVSLSGLYYYIGSKQELLYLIQIHTFTTILEQLRLRLRGVVLPAERLYVLVHNHLEYFLRHPHEMKVLAHEDEELEGEYGKEVAAIKRHYYGVALDIFKELRAGESTRGANPRLAVLSLFGMMNWIHTWHRSQVDPQAPELATAMTQMFLYGVKNGHHAVPAKPPRSGRNDLTVAKRAAG